MLTTQQQQQRRLTVASLEADKTNFSPFFRALTIVFTANAWSFSFSPSLSLLSLSRAFLQTQPRTFMTTINGFDCLSNRAFQSPSHLWCSDQNGCMIPLLPAATEDADAASPVHFHKHLKKSYAASSFSLILIPLTRSHYCGAIREAKKRKKQLRTLNQVC